jgi:nucleotide-binding universal stress UspA family protein
MERRPASWLAGSATNATLRHEALGCFHAVKGGEQDGAQAGSVRPKALGERVEAAERLAKPKSIPTHRARLGEAAKRARVQPDAACVRIPAMAAPEAPVRRVLVATDRSETAARAVAFAADMAERYGAELFVLQVIVPGGDPTTADATRAAYAAKDLELYVEELAGERGRSRVVVDEDPALAIVEAAEEEHADVVVVGNAGMSGRKEFLLGNVPNRVSHNARCSVVIFNSTGTQPGEDDDRGVGRFLRRRP